VKHLLRVVLRRLPKPLKLRLKAGAHAVRRAASRASRTRLGGALFDRYVALRSSSTSGRLSELVERTEPLELSPSAAWFRLATRGARRYLVRIETADDLAADSKAAVVQYRFISERGRVRRDADVGKAWSLKLGYHEFLPRVPRDRVSSVIVLTPPGTRAVDIGLSSRTGSVSITRVTVDELGPRTIVPAYDAPVSTPRSDLRIAAIADTFTITALRFEAHVLPVPGADWAMAFDDFRPDLLLVESAWNGNDGAWQYRIANLKADDRRLADLIDHARAAGVPVLFWNKEDPAHYSDFIAAARLCDVVATTDADVIPRYVAELGHERVFALPFCIQPDVHNPRQPDDGREERIAAAGFLGSWWAEKFDDRRDAQEALFAGATDFGLEIFDRYLTFNDHERYRIPPEWLPFVHGTLSYDQALSAYRRYAVLLNVNTVTDSATMFSRRALEASASGALVVSNPSAGTAAALGDLVVTVGSAAECRTALARLAEDPGALALASHRAYRHTHLNHSWSRRLDDVAEQCGLRRPARATPKISVVLATKRPEGADRIIRYLASLDDSAFTIEPIVITAFDPAELCTADEVERSGARVERERAGETLGDCLNRGADMATGRFVAKVDDDDLYGPRYFHDLLLAIDHSRADIVGKQCHYQYFEGADTTVVRYPGAEHRFTEFVCGSTLLAKASVYERIRFPQRRIGEDTEFLRRATAAGLRIYSADRFSYVSQRRADLASHTWQAHDDEILRSEMSRPFCSGLPLDHLEA
jgi:hypothetical protein